METMSNFTVDEFCSLQGNHRSRFASKRKSQDNVPRSNVQKVISVKCSYSHILQRREQKNLVIRKDECIHASTDNEEGGLLSPFCSAFAIEERKKITTQPPPCFFHLIPFFPFLLPSSHCHVSVILQVCFLPNKKRGFHTSSSNHRHVILSIVRLHP